MRQQQNPLDAFRSPAASGRAYQSSTARLVQQRQDRSMLRVAAAPINGLHAHEEESAEWSLV